MKLTRKEKFLNKFDNEIYKEVFVYITMPNLPYVETIINPKGNFKSKKEYYDKAYNDMLELKTNPEIRILAYSFKKDRKLSHERNESNVKNFMGNERNSEEL